MSSKYKSTIRTVGDTRYKMPPERRKIGGKVYRYFMWFSRKADAEKEAKRQTDKYGLITKVVRSLNGWAIYYRHK